MDVGGGGYDGAGPPGYLQGNRVVRYTDADLLRAGRHDIWDLGILLYDDGEGPGQECLDELVCGFIKDRHGLHHLPVGDSHG